MNPWIGVLIFGSIGVFMALFGFMVLCFRLTETRGRLEDLQYAVDFAITALRYYRGQDGTYWVQGQLFEPVPGGNRLVEAPELEAENALVFLSSYQSPEPPCDHAWFKRRAGGNPADANSYETIISCTLCGAEPAGD